MRHLYIHVPFCARRCSYCDFSIAVRNRVPADEFVAAILGEYQLRKSSGAWDDEPLETQYLGGGTPSRLPPEHIARLTEFFLEHESAPNSRSSRLLPSLPASGPRSLPPSTVPHRPPTSSTVPLEITLEANPDDITLDTAKTWLASGVNRVSLGVQSFIPHVLSWMHRTHTVEDSLGAMDALRTAGIGSISVDLIFGLPDQVESDFEADVRRAASLGPDHLSVYGLTSEARTPLARWIERGAASPADDNRYANEFLLAHDLLTSAGYEHYEVSNYAKPGHSSRHNRAYWTGSRYAGLGPSAHSFSGVVRSWNVAPWTAYQRVVVAGDDPTEGSESLSGDQVELERTYLALRTSTGLQREFVGSLNPAALEAAAERGWVLLDDTGVRCTPQGWLRLDALTTGLTTSAQGG